MKIQMLLLCLLSTVVFSINLQTYQLGKVHTKILRENGRTYLSLNLAALLLDSHTIEAILSYGMVKQGVLKNIKNSLYVENQFLESKFGIGFRIDPEKKRIYPSKRLRPKPFEGIPVRATSFEAQKIASPGERGNFEMSDYDIAAALPSRKYLGRKIFVFYPKTGKSLVVPVTDVGPWNTKDSWLLKGRRPKAENGHDERGRRTNLAGIDLSYAAWEALGIPWSKVIQGNTSDYVEIMLLD
jgi:hypothetical protein